MPIISGGRVIEGAIGRSENVTAANTAANPSYHGSASWARVRYDFAVLGGAVSTIPVVGTAIIPANAVILEAGVDVVTIPTSGGAATVAVQVEGAGDIIAAAAITGAPWSTTGRKSAIPQNFGTSARTTVARDVSVVVATAALTAGVFDVYLKYLVVA
jgi:hypothetical protein